MANLVKDTLLASTGALPNGTTSTYTGALDTGNVTGDFVAPVEFQLTVPAVAVGALANSETLKYDVVSSTASGLTTNAVIEIPAIITQTGAGGAGAAGTSKIFKLPNDTQRYVGVKITNSSTLNASTGTCTIAGLL